MDKKKKIVLIDDDEIYTKIFHSFVSTREIDCDCYTALGDMGSIGRFRDYDAAVIDFDLGSMTGIEIAEYIPIFFGRMPVIIISGKNRRPENGVFWPSSVRKFIHKDQGFDVIVRGVEELIENPSRPFVSIDRSAVI